MIGPKLSSRITAMSMVDVGEHRRLEPARPALATRGHRCAPWPLGHCVGDLVLEHVELLAARVSGPM